MIFSSLKGIEIYIGTAIVYSVGMYLTMKFFLTETFCRHKIRDEEVWQNTLDDSLHINKDVNTNRQHTGNVILFPFLSNDR